MTYQLRFVFVVGLLGGFIACQKDGTNRPVTQLEIPAHFPEPVYSFTETENVVSKDGFKLGRKLFYDPILSIDGTVSCATCHAQVHAFADHNMSLSVGINDLEGTRNSPPLFNLAWYPTFMWDGGVNHIEIMPLAPILNPVEMGEEMKSVLDKLNADEDYLKLFEKAFDVEEATDKYLFYALTQFMGTIVSDGAKYDEVIRGNAKFSADEQRGYELFQTNCASCHQEPLFTDFSFRNNGLDTNFDEDSGRALITQQEVDMGKFKVPTLRNLGYTYPYMHDGRFFTLEEVLEHYNSGVKQSATLDESLTDGILLTNENKDDLIAFLKTLDDYVFTGDLRYSEPRN